MIRSRTSIARRCSAWWLLGIGLAAASSAAEPEFKTAIVTESRVYERHAGSVSVGGFETGRAAVTMSRVTVAIDGEHITGEWQPKTTISATARDFSRGAEVLVGVSRNQLRLRHPDGSVVAAKIVKREKPTSTERHRSARD